MERVLRDVLGCVLGDVLLRASILDFKPRLGNHCKIIPKNTLQRAVILDLRGSIGESLHVLPQKCPRRCSDS